jgi:hypothetical protein
MDAMFLKDVEDKPIEGELAEKISQMKSQGAPVPQIWHLFNFKPGMTSYLARFTQEVMRGPSPLTSGMRELIAAFTSSQNQCPF